MHLSYDDTEVQNTKKYAQGQTTCKRGGAIWAGKGTEEQKAGGLEVETSRSIDRRSGKRLSWSREAGGLLSSHHYASLSTHNAVWGRRAPDETLHLATITPNSVLHRLAGDNGGPCKQKRQSGSAGTYRACLSRPSPFQATHRSHKVAPPAQPLRSEARWPGRCRCRHLPGSPTSIAAGCCCSEPGQREQPRVGSQEAWAPRSVWAPHERHWRESRKGQ